MSFDKITKPMAVVISIGIVCFTIFMIAVVITDQNVRIARSKDFFNQSPCQCTKGMNNEAK